MWPVDDHFSPGSWELFLRGNETLKGKTIQRGQLGNSPHKFVWYKPTHKEFEQLTRGKRIEDARSKRRWLFLPFEPGNVLLLGQCGG